MRSPPSDLESLLQRGLRYALSFLNIFSLRSFKIGLCALSVLMVEGNVCVKPEGRGASFRSRLPASDSRKANRGQPCMKSKQTL